MDSEYEVVILLSEGETERKRQVRICQPNASLEKLACKTYRVAHKYRQDP